MDNLFSTPSRAIEICQNSGKKESIPYYRRRLNVKNLKLKGPSFDLDVEAKNICFDGNTFIDIKRRRCSHDGSLREAENYITVPQSPQDESSDHLNVNYMGTPPRRNSKSVFDYDQPSKNPTTDLENCIPRRSRRNLFDASNMNQEIHISSFNCNDHNQSWYMDVETPKKLNSSMRRFDLNLSSLPACDRTPPTLQRPFMFGEDECNDKLVRRGSRHLRKANYTTQSEIVIDQEDRVLHDEDDDHNEIALLARASSSVSPRCNVLSVSESLSDLYSSSSPPHTPIINGKFEEVDACAFLSPQAPLRVRRSRKCIMLGIMAHDVSTVIEALNENEDLNSEILVSERYVEHIPFDRHVLPLLAASLHLQYDIIHILLLRGAIVNSVNSLNQNASHLVCIRNSYHAFFIKQGVSSACSGSQFVPDNAWTDASASDTNWLEGLDSKAKESSYQPTLLSEVRNKLSDEKACKLITSKLQSNVCNDIDQTVPEPVSGHSCLDALDFKVNNDELRGVKPKSENKNYFVSIQVMIIRILQLLAAHGLNLHACDANKKQPIDYARESRYKEVEQFLLNPNEQSASVSMDHDDIISTPQHGDSSEFSNSSQLPRFPIYYDDLSQCGVQDIWTPFNKYKSKRYLNFSKKMLNVSKNKYNKLPESNPFMFAERLVQDEQ